MAMTKDEITEAITKIVKKWISYDHYRVFYFGSRADGTAHERSDYDIGIDAGKKISAKVMIEIQEELDQLPTLLKFDWVDFYSVTDDFKQIALKQIEIIYEEG